METYSDRKTFELNSPVGIVGTSILQTNSNDPEPKNNHEDSIKKIILMAFGVYSLFVISMLFSVLYIEQNSLHYFFLDAYIIKKVLWESLINTLVIFTSGWVLNIILKFLDIYHNTTPENETSKQVRSNPVIHFFTFLLVSIVFLPLKTVVSVFYIGFEGTYFRFNFVHFSTTFKIITSIIILAFLATYLIRKYSSELRNIALLLLIIMTPLAYGIINTRTENFETLDAEIGALENQDLFHGSDLVNKERGEKVKPLAERLLKIARTPGQKASAYAYIAKAEVDLSNNEQALEDIDKAIELEPNESIHHRTKATIYRAIEDFPKAREEAEKCVAIALSKNSLRNAALCEGEIAASYLYEGQTIHHYLKKEFFDSAKEHFEKAANLNPENVFFKKRITEVNLWYAVYYINKDNYTEAIDQVDIFLELVDPINKDIISWAYAIRGKAKSNLKDYKGATEDLELSIKLNPKRDKTVHSNLAWAYEELGNHEKAIEYYDKALTQESNGGNGLSDREILENEIIIFEATNNTQRALEAREKLINLPPTNND